MFESIFAEYITIQGIIEASLVSVLGGLIIALTCKYATKTSKDFLVALTIIPLLVMTVIMLVNGNLGIGVAVAGSFSLIRFRSLPGTASDIAIVFLAMALGLATGVGYLGVGILIVISSCFLFFVFNKINLFESKDNNHRFLKILLSESDDPENLQEIFSEYCNKFKLISLKTVDLGSLYELEYEIDLKDIKNERKFIDDLRVRNGNLTVRSTSVNPLSSATL